MARVNGTPINSPRAHAIQKAAEGVWLSRLELSRKAGVKSTSGDFYVVALFKAGRLMRRLTDRKSHPCQSGPMFEYRLKGS